MPFKRATVKRMGMLAEIVYRFNISEKIEINGDARYG